MRTFTQIRTLYCSDLSILAWVLGFFILFPGCSSDKKDRPSPFRSDSTLMGGASMKVEFSSPRVRKRKIWGDLVEYGKMWRTGVNEATAFSTSKPLNVDTFQLDSGKYAIFTIPGKEEWEVIFNKEWDQWGSNHHNDSLDVIRMKVIPKSFTDLQENMELFFENDSLKFRWEKIGWGIPLHTTAD